MRTGMNANKLLQAYGECGLLFVLVWFGFVLFGRGCMNHMFPASYAWGNFSVLAVGIWAIVQRDSLDAIMMVSVSVFDSHEAAQGEGGGQTQLFWVSDEFWLFPI